uniref:Sosondowah ankyrin repeat domain family member A n=1 Tax=Chelonoidis abingdonii TaxID=106734 RepID=A0A8C0GXY5_CHEAB
GSAARLGEEDGETPGPPPGMAGPPRREAPQKPCMLPVRCPQPARGAEELPRQQEQLEDRARRQVDEPGVSEETGCTAAVPLESLEHEWLVKATAGQWSQQLHGLLLTDANLAGKRDFMTGFTALHWAAKSGNCDMVGKIIEVAKKGGTEIDVNAKSYGGYTPLHIAAIHGREDVITTLVKTYNVKVNLRDYSGKKPHHYLKEGSSYAVRHLLGLVYAEVDVLRSTYRGVFTTVSRVLLILYQLHLCLSRTWSTGVNRKALGD